MAQLIIGDIHGCYKEFRDLLDKAGLGDGDEIIAIGDLLDRGPKPRKIIKYFMNNPHALALQGNHERKTYPRLCW